MWLRARRADELDMKAFLCALLLVGPALAASWPRGANRGEAAGCPAAVELFRRAASMELFSPKAVIRVYGESADGKDLGHRDLSLEEYRGLAGDLERWGGRHGQVRCERDGENWLVTALRLTGKRTPVSALITVETGRLWIVSASFVQTAEYLVPLGQIGRRCVLFHNLTR